MCRLVVANEVVTVVVELVRYGFYCWEFGQGDIALVGCD
jgi:hypothetical protein